MRGYESRGICLCLRSSYNVKPNLNSNLHNTSYTTSAPVAVVFLLTSKYFYTSFHIICDNKFNDYEIVQVFSMDNDHSKQGKAPRRYCNIC